MQELGRTTPSHPRDPRRHDGLSSTFAIIDHITTYIALSLYGLLGFLSSRPPRACRATVCSA
jgi:hypothetical protein